MTELWLIGHSLGAGHADALAAHFTADGRPPDRTVLAGEPRPGFSKLAALIGGNPRRTSLCCEGEIRPYLDKVTTVPFNLGPLQDYVTPSPFTVLDVTPAPDDPWQDFKYHHIQLYDGAVPAEYRDAVDLMVDLYDDAKDPSWDLLIKPPPGGKSVCVGIRRLETAIAVVCRGSTTLWDWLRDFDAIANPWNHSVFGPVHPGFFLDMDSVYQRVKDFLNG